jgi:hypothetical protein
MLCFGRTVLSYFRFRHADEKQAWMEEHFKPDGGWACALASYSPFLTALLGCRQIWLTDV